MWGVDICDTNVKETKKKIAQAHSRELSAKNCLDKRFSTLICFRKRLRGDSGDRLMGLSLWNSLLQVTNGYLTELIPSNARTEGKVSTWYCCKVAFWASITDNYGKSCKDWKGNFIKKEKDIVKAHANLVNAYGSPNHFLFFCFWSLFCYLHKL